MISDVASVPVVILCGGKGLRIREVSELLPKPMLQIGGRPILWHIMMGFAQYGFRRFILCLGYKGSVIRDYFLKLHAHSQDVTLTFNGQSNPPDIEYHGEHNANLDWSVTLAETGAETLTGGRVARIARYLDQPDFLLTYGDGVGNVDLLSLLTWHRNHNASISVTGVRPQSRFGQLEITGDRVIQFTEKPQTHDGYISGGFMAVDREFVKQYLDESESCILEKDGLTRAAADGEMRVFRHDGFWMPMDNSLEFNALNALWASGDAPWKVW